VSSSDDLRYRSSAADAEKSHDIFECASNVWSLCLVGLIEKLEALQRNFTERIPGMKTKPCSQRLESLHLESLVLFRLKVDLILTYNIMVCWIWTHINFLNYARTASYAGMTLRLFLSILLLIYVSILFLRQYIASMERATTTYT